MHITHPQPAEARTRKSPFICDRKANTEPEKLYIVVFLASTIKITCSAA